VDDAHETARFARQVAATGVGRSRLDQISMDISRFATDYAFQPLSEIFVDIRE
jgi:hypothetical protein